MLFEIVVTFATRRVGDKEPLKGEKNMQSLFIINLNLISVYYQTFSVLPHPDT